MKDKWECFLCSFEQDFELLPYAYLSNSHPLCYKCANLVLNNENHKQRFRLSFHKDIGDIIISGNIPLKIDFFSRN